MSVTTIMIFGTFDMIHPGHENFFQQARAAGEDPFLVVSVARDSAVRRVKKASPQNPEKSRLEKVLTHPLVDYAVLGDESGYVHHIAAIKPDIIALGYDQSGEYVDTLEKDLEEAGLSIQILTLAPFMPEIYKTSKLHGKPDALM